MYCVRVGVPPETGAHVELGPFLIEANCGGGPAKLSLILHAGDLMWPPKSSVLSSPTLGPCTCLTQECDPCSAPPPAQLLVLSSPPPCEPL